jgi:hypothetical protein
MSEEWEKKQLEELKRMREEREKENEERKLKWRAIYGSDDRWNRMRELYKDMDKRIAKRIAEKDKK